MNHSCHVMVEPVTSTGGVTSLPLYTMCNLSKSNPRPFPLSPAEDSAQQGGVEALRGREAPLHLAHRHLVLGGGAEQREATRHRTEHLGRVGHHAHAQALLAHGQRREGRAVEFGRDGDCEGGGRKNTGECLERRRSAWGGGGGGRGTISTHMSAKMKTYV